MSVSLESLEIDSSKFYLTWAAKRPLSTLIRYDIDRQSAEETIQFLRGFDDDILAVWILSRPIRSGFGKGKFEHWCIKIHTGDTILELDFGEKSTQGVFGCHHVTAVPTLSLDCMYYYLIDEDRNYTRYPYEMVSGVAPQFTLDGDEFLKRQHQQAKNNLPLEIRESYQKHLLENEPRFIPYWIHRLMEQAYQEMENSDDDDDDDSDSDEESDEEEEDSGDNNKKERKEADKKKKKKKNNNNNKNDSNNNKDTLRKQLRKYLQLPELNKKVSDIGDFLSQWTRKHSAYDAVYSNCQRFAYDLFEFLVERIHDDKKQAAKNELEKALYRLQSWYDKKPKHRNHLN